MLNDLLYSWRKNRGLDYNGWLSFVFKRWLRRNKLGFVVPFDMTMNWQNSSNVTLDIWEWGKHRQEKIKFSDELYAAYILMKLRHLGMTGSADKYKVMQAIGKRI